MLGTDDLLRGAIHATAVTAYMEHYHAERNHQGLENKLIQPSDEVGQIAGRIESRERLGGMLKYYYRTAA